MKKIVVIGGGSGSFTVLRGLKHFPLDITAVVTMFDSGGSSGALRDEFGVLPVGDVRQCLIALSEENGEKTFQKLFDYRFQKECSFRGHNFGNLFLLVLSQISGDEPKAITKAAQILNVKGRVLPVSLDRAHIHAELVNGQVIVGETNIDVPMHDGTLRIKRVFLDKQAGIYPEVAAAITQADLVVIGPGDLYTSIIPNFLVDGMRDTICQSEAKKIYIPNLMTKWGETHNFTASDFALEVLKYTGLAKFDYILLNKKVLPQDLLRSYAGENKYPVLYDAAIGACADKIILGDLSSQDNALKHDSAVVAEIITSLEAGKQKTAP